MKAWVYQDSASKKKHGDKAPWSVGWYDNEGCRRKKKLGLKTAAVKYARKLEGQFAAGLYETEARTSWDAFCEEYKAKVLDVMEPNSRQAMQHCIDHFVRICKPTAMRRINNRTIDEFAAKRRVEGRSRSKPLSSDARRGNSRKADRTGPRISPATVNKELRHIRAMLRKAHKWGHLTEVPQFEFVREPEKLPTYVSPEDFDSIYQACELARLPADQPYGAATWWRALLVLAYMTGWRINQMLLLRREDVNLEAAQAVTRASDNKGKRDAVIPLHPLVVEHLGLLTSFSPMMLPWNYNRRTLYHEFQRIQEQGGVRAPDGKQRFGFHDLRRGFATMNADRLTADALQSLMQHRNYETTKRYVNMGRQLRPAIEQVFVPEIKIVKLAN